MSKFAKIWSVIIVLYTIVSLLVLINLKIDANEGGCVAPLFWLVSVMFMLTPLMGQGDVYRKDQIGKTIIRREKLENGLIVHRSVKRDGEWKDEVVDSGCVTIICVDTGYSCEGFKYFYPFLVCLEDEVLPSISDRIDREQLREYKNSQRNIRFDGKTTYAYCYEHRYLYEDINYNQVRVTDWFGTRMMQNKIHLTPSTNWH